jgi:site-specific DNA-methyltransferase (adenine-specific)
MNKLYFGDNLEIMRKYIADETVDLIYLDPPFNSQRAYNVFFPEKSGNASAAQIQAFEDTWTWTSETERTFEEIILGRSTPADLKVVMQAFRSFMGNTDLMAYLTMMAVRLVEMNRILKPTGSIYLHCDPSASHYLKILLDQIFGAGNMINEIVWQRTNTKSLQSRRFPNCHDIILAYSKTNKYLFQKIYSAYNTEYLDGFYKYNEKETGRRYRLSDVTNPNKNRPNLTYEWKGVRRVWRWTKDKMEDMDKSGRLIYSKSGLPQFKRYLDEMPGVPINDVWTDIRPIGAHSKESLDYPTQKPVTLLERILEASSSAGDVIMDPFCGCGTAIAAAEKLGRKWIGIDITFLAIALIKNRITDHYLNAEFEIVGEPKSAYDAEQLFLQSAFHFESWAVSLLGGQPYKSKGGGDSGIDGRLYFQDNRKKFHHIIIEVKGGGYQPKDIRALKSVMDRESAPMGILLALKPPTKGMLSETAAFGTWKMPNSGRIYPVMQIKTIQEIFDGKGPVLPDTSGTLKKAEKKLRDKEKPLKLF